MSWPMPHRPLIALYALVAIPWYWSFMPNAWAMISLAGLPMWAFVTLAASFGVSLHTALVFMRPWEFERDESLADKDSS